MSARAVLEMKKLGIEQAGALLGGSLQLAPIRDEGPEETEEEEKVKVKR